LKGARRVRGGEQRIRRWYGNNTTEKRNFTTVCDVKPIFVVLFLAIAPVPYKSYVDSCRYAIFAGLALIRRNPWLICVVGPCKSASSSPFCSKISRNTHF
jgi:hypothetical protein